MNTYFQHVAPLLALFLPMLSGTLLLLLSAQKYKHVRRKLFLFSLMGTFAMWLTLWLTYYPSETMFYILGYKLANSLTLEEFKTLTLPIFYFDPFTLFAGTVLTFVAVLIPFMRSESFFALHRTRHIPALYSLLLASLLGMLTVSDFFTLFFYLHCAIVSLYFLMTSKERGGDFRIRALHVFLSFSLGQFFLVIGIGILYALYGSTSMLQIAESISAGKLERIAFVLILSPFLQLLALPPLHLWFQELLVIPGHVAFKHSVVLFFMVCYWVLARIVLSVFGGVFTSGVFSGVFLLWVVLGMLCLLRSSLRMKNVKQFIMSVTISQTTLALLGLSVSAFSAKSAFAMAQSGYAALTGGLLLSVSFPFLLILLFGIPNQYCRSLYFFDAERKGLRVFIALFTILLASIGLPPFVGYTARLMLVQSAFAINPLLASLVIFLMLFQILSLIYVFLRKPDEGIVENLFTGGSTRYTAESRAKVAFVTGVLMFLCVIALSVSGYPSVTRILSPAVDALINKGEYRLSIFSEGEE